VKEFVLVQWFSNDSIGGGEIRLKAAGCETIFTEKVSGKSTNGRKEFLRLMKALSPGDTVVVTKLDRLGRSTRELLDLIERIGKAGASFRCQRHFESDPGLSISAL